LNDGRAADFVIAVNEIASNAVAHGSPVARLLRHTEKTMVVAEIRDRRNWRPGAKRSLSAAGIDRRGMGLPVARQVCDEVEIQRGHRGTVVTLRMSLRRENLRHR
jgi:anti-sigma regulatory factor (Ser/Thr protein kinase)